MGLDHTRRPSRRRNRSGEAEATCTPADGHAHDGRVGGRVALASAAPSAATSAPAGAGADSTRQRFTWYTSPAAMASRMVSTPFS